jgi:VPDSG-CTERM motif
MNKIKYLAAVVIGIAGFGLQQAKAFESSLNVGNSGLTEAGFNGPYGTVSITLSGNIATVTFTSSGNYLFGDGGSVAINVNGSFSTVAGSLTGSGPNAHQPDLSFAGAGHEDGFGDFNLTINNFDGFEYAANTISFQISGNWASADQVLAFNSSLYDAAAHIFVSDGQGNNTGVTGYAGEGVGTVPDGGTTVMLLGMGLGALGMVRRYLMS